MSVKLTTNLSQRLVLTPQLRQRIEMLQMTSLELSDLIQQQLLENPVLEEVPAQEEKRELEEHIIDQLASGNNNLELAGGDPVVAELSPPTSNGAGDAAAVETMTASVEAPEAAPPETGEEVEERERDSFEEIDFGREFQEYLDPGYKTQEWEYKDDEPTFEQFLTRPVSLSEHLTEQLHLNDVPDELLPVADAVIGNLDTDGRINATHEEIAALGGWPESLIEEARQIVMRLDPLGCGARDVRECLLIQLEACGELDRLAAPLIREHALADL